MKRLREVLALAAVAAGVAGFSGSAGADVRLEKIGDFRSPVHVAGAPGDDQRLYVVEQAGVVRVVRGGASSTFADLTREVEHGGEQGLLSIAFPPDFQSSRLLYVYYTERGGEANVVAELRTTSGDTADPGSLRPVLRIPHPNAGNHNGGQMQFGPDGLLWLAPGDGARRTNAPSTESLLGKLLRIDPRGGIAGSYTVPADNPFVGVVGARPEVWAVGLRNPYRFSFDRGSGDLILGDVGEGTTEEITILSRAGGLGRGADLGWPTCEGSFATGSRTEPCTRGVLPAIDKFADAGYRSIIPGFVVRDPSLPSLAGRLVYGDFFRSDLRSALPTTPRATDDRPLGVTVPSLTSFGEDAAGCVYATSQNGPVHRLVEQDARVPCALTPAPPVPPSPDPPGGGDDGRRDRGGRFIPLPGVGVDTFGRKRQRVLRLGGVVVVVDCSSRCRIFATGKLRIGRRAYGLGRTVRTIRSGRRMRVLVPLPRRGRTALRRALRARRPARAIVRVGARIGRERVKPVTAVVRVRR